MADKPIVAPTPLPPSPPVPQRNDEATFEDRFDAGWQYMFDVLRPGIDATAQNVHNNALAADERAVEADGRATDAETAKGLAEEARDAAQDWAESPAAPSPGSQSAKTWAGEAGAYRDQCEVIAAAAQSAAGLPAIAGKAGHVLRVNATGNGVEWGLDIATGDIVATARSLSAPDWLACDGSLYLRATYPALSALLAAPDPIELPMVGVLPVSTTGVRTNNAAAVGQGKIIVVGTGENDYWAYESNPNVWYSFAKPFAANRNAIAYANGTWVVVGANGKIATSPDGVTWTERTSGTSGNLLGIAYGDGKWIATEQSSYARYSTNNGVNWSNSSTTGGHSAGRVRFANGLFVAVKSSGSGVYTSANGTAWTSRTTWLDSSTSYGLCFGNGTWVVVGANGKIATSPDGVTWTERTSGTSNNLVDVSYGNGLFMAVDADSNAIISPDGITWTPLAGTNLSSLVSWVRQLLFVGDYWIVLSSVDSIYVSNHSLVVAKSNYDVSTLFPVPDMPIDYDAAQYFIKT